MKQETAAGVQPGHFRQRIAKARRLQPACSRGTAASFRRAI
ncbi:MAG: hypothetical protein ACLQF1_16265 [Methyloceanibacter sp.]